MKEKIIYFVFMLMTVTAADHAETKLSQGRALFYREIGCNPMTEGGMRYECPDFKQVIKKDKCIFEGREYDLGVELSDDSGIYRYCQAACRCMM